MNTGFGYVPLAKLWGALVVAAALALAGCGDEDLCTDVSCEFGTCDSASGQCVNPNQCRVDGDCIPGYECGEDYSCTAVVDCEDDDGCDAGVCRSGACVNPSKCESNDDCVERTFCGPSNTCEADPCSDVTCQRGVCERGTDNCVSADSCTTATETLDCVAGERCAEGTCKNRDDFCEDITCERGECSFEAGGCASVDDCQGNDELCAVGEFCNDQNQCQDNLCEQRDVDCGDSGICVPALGECQNATTCTENADCTDNHLCVGDTCLLAGVACGDAGGDGGCPGGQLCEYDASNLTASCTEPAQCTTSFDCVDQRQCGGLHCLEPVTCRDDYYEPNETSDEATDFLAMANGRTVSGSICASDTDVFTFESGELVNPSARGTLLIEVDVPTRDQGLGQIEVTLTDESGATRESSSGALGVNGGVRIEKAIGVTDHGEYTVEIKAADDLKEAGVRYDLSVNLLPTETIKACEDALALRVNQRVSGDTETSSSEFIGSSCTSDPNTSKEVVYALTLDAPQEVTFQLTPQLSATNLSMSLRSRCTQASSERACADNTGDGEKETMTALLEAGTHYLVVQSPEEATGGAFELMVRTVYTACADGDAYCEDGDIAQTCSTGGGRFTSLDCEAGCNPSNGRCFPPAGDVCFDAPAIDMDTSREIQLGQLNNEYDLSVDGCGDQDVAKSDGPEQTFRIELPAQKAVTADVLFANEVEGALYFVSDCGDAAATCLGSASGTDKEVASHEVLNYANFSETDSETIYLVVDTQAGQALTVADLEVTFHDISCTPGARQCGVSGDAEMCDEYGIGYRLEEECGDLQCGNGGYCLSSETCNTAMPLADGDWDEQTFQGSVEIPVSSGTYGSCNFESSNTPASGDHIYAIDLQEDDVLTVDYDVVSGYTGWGVAYILETCGDLNSCQFNGGTFSSSGDQFQFIAPSDGTYYLVMARYDGNSSATYRIDIDIRPLECDRDTHTAQCDVNGDVEFCAGMGFLETFSCGGGGCTNATCDSGNADYCFDAEDITTAASQAGGLTKSIDWSQSHFTNRLEQDLCGGITSSENDGQDAYYRVDLLAGQTLVATLDNGSNFDDPALIITDECRAPGDSCLAGDEDSDTASVHYYARTDQTVYLIADNDDGSDSSDTFTLDAQILPGCDPLTHTPTCQGGDVAYCNASYYEDTYNCGGNGCSSGMCNSTASDWCFDAEDITTASKQTGGTTKSIDWSQHLNYLEQDLCGGIDDYENDGQDAYYRVDLSAGERLTASLSNGSGTDDPALLVTSACTAPGQACLAGDEDTSTASVEYLAQQAETVYLIADNDDGSGSTETHTLDVEVVPADCNPASHVPSCSDATTLQACDNMGYLVPVTCGTSCQSGACTPPSGETCSDAIPMAHGDSFTSTFDAQVNSMTTGSGSVGACSFTSSNSGDDPEYVFEVTLLANEQLTVTYDSGVNASTTGQGVMFLMSDCADVNTCLMNEGRISSSSQPFTMTYTAPQNETVYLVVARNGGTDSSYDFQIDVDIQ